MLLAFPAKKFFNTVIQPPNRLLYCVDRISCDSRSKIVTNDIGPFPVIIAELHYSWNENQAPQAHIKEIQDNKKAHDNDSAAYQRWFNIRHFVFNHQYTGKT